jgi:serine/threonine protein kinase
VEEDRGVLFIAMVWLKGETLDARLKREKRLPIADALTIGNQIAERLDVGHECGLVHLDIKPTNIWLSSDSLAPVSQDKGGGEELLVKVVNFDLADATAGEGAHLAKTGSILRTPVNVAQVHGRSEQVDLRRDLFNLGVVLYQVLTGELPFTRLDSSSQHMALEKETPKPVQAVNPAVPFALSELVMKLLARTPKQRPFSAKAVAETMARELFLLQRERLEADFFKAATASGKPRGLQWKDCHWKSEFVLARDHQSGKLAALVSITIRFEALPGSDMEGLPAVGNLRDASAVFFVDCGHWHTVGKAIFNLNPDEVVAHFKNQYERAERHSSGPS